MTRRPKLGHSPGSRLPSPPGARADPAADSCPAPAPAYTPDTPLLLPAMAHQKCGSGIINTQATSAGRKLLCFNSKAARTGRPTTVGVPPSVGRSSECCEWGGAGRGCACGRNTTAAPTRRRNTCCQQVGAAVGDASPGASISGSERGAAAGRRAGPAPVGSDRKHHVISGAIVAR